MKVQTYHEGIPIRVFIAKPAKGYTTHWRVMPIPNMNISKDNQLMRPEVFNGHEKPELYYHVSEIEKLQAIIDRLNQMLSGSV